MSKLKVGDITIENGSISFSNHSSSQSVQTSTQQSMGSFGQPHSAVPPQQFQKIDSTHNSSEDLISKIPDNKALLFGIGGVFTAVGASVLYFTQGVISLVAFPLLSIGIGGFILSFVKGRYQAKKLAIQDEKDSKIKKQNEEAVLEFFRKNDQQWTVEDIDSKKLMSSENLLITLKLLVDTQRLIEDMDPQTGNWFLILNKEHKKESAQSLTLEERLNNMRSE